MLTQAQRTFLDEVIALASTKFDGVAYSYRDLSAEVADGYDVDSPKGYWTQIAEFTSGNVATMIYFNGNTVQIGDEPYGGYAVMDISTDSNFVDSVHQAAFMLM